VVRGIPEVSEIDEPHEDADDRDDLGEHVSEVIKLAFQRSLFADLRRNGLVNVADGRVLTGKNNDSARVPIHNCCALVRMCLIKRAVDRSEEEVVQQTAYLSYLA
jgi:hypothetical protein